MTTLLAHTYHRRCRIAPRADSAQPLKTQWITEYYDPANPGRRTAPRKAGVSALAYNPAWPPILHVYSCLHAGYQRIDEIAAAMQVSRACVNKALIDLMALGLAEKHRLRTHGYCFAYRPSGMNTGATNEQGN